MMPKARVLVVDDKPEGLLSLEAVLRASGGRFDIVTASSGREAIEYVHNSDTEFAVILLDVQMPEMDGFEAARRIRAFNKYVPIIFITAISRDEIHVFKGYDSGAVDYLFKPLNSPILQSKVAIFVDLFYKNEMLKEHERREKELSGIRYRNLADAIPHLVIKTDRNGLGNYFNQGWTHYTGMSTEESAGRGWESVFHSNEFTGFMNTWREAALMGDRFETRLVVRRADQSERWHLLQGVPEFSSSGEINGWLFTGTDIQNEMETRMKLEEQARDLKRSNNDLEQFAYVASHDLQEPLRKVRNYVDLLEIYSEETLNEKTQKCLSVIVDGVKRMQQLISALLDYSRVSKMGDSIAEEVDVRSEVDFAIESIAAAKDAKISIENLPRVRGNGVQVRQLFQNLVANAIKFRNQEPSHIWIGTEMKDGVPAFFVKDNGIGIPRDYTDKIFVIFHRLHTRDRYPGTGIGLAICKKIVETHGGRIWVESEVGKGTSVYFTLPVLNEESVVA